MSEEISRGQCPEENVRGMYYRVFRDKRVGLCQSMQIGAGLIRMSATHSLQIASTEHFFLLKNFVLLQIYFYFPIFEKYSSKIEEFSSRIIHSGTSHCPGMDLAGTRDISFHSGTVLGNPGHLVTLNPPHKPSSVMAG